MLLQSDEGQTAMREDGLKVETMRMSAIGRTTWVDDPAGGPTVTVMSVAGQVDSTRPLGAAAVRCRTESPPDTTDSKPRRSGLMLREIRALVLAAREADPGEADSEQRKGGGLGNWRWIGNRFVQSNRNAPHGKEGAGG